MDDERQSIEPELRRGETLVWAGRGSSIGSMRDSIGLVCAGGVYAAVAALWMFLANALRGVASSPQIYVFKCLGAFFLVLGVFVVCMPIVQAARVRRTVYGVTTERAIVVHEGRVRRVMSYSPEDLQELERVDIRDDRGNVYFARTPADFAPHSSRRRSEVPIKRLGFEGIENPRDAETALRELKARGVQAARTEA